MVYKKKGKWKVSGSAKKYDTEEEALLAEGDIEEVGLEEVCDICNGLECQCVDLWKSVDQT